MRNFQGTFETRKRSFNSAFNLHGSTFKVLCITCYIVWNSLRVNTDRFSSRAYGYIQIFRLANNFLATQSSWIFFLVFSFFSFFKVSGIFFGFYWFCMDKRGCCWRHQRTSSYEKVSPMLKLKCMKICCVEMMEC